MGQDKYNASFTTGIHHAAVPPSKALDSTSRDWGGLAAGVSALGGLLSALSQARRQQGQQAASAPLPSAGTARTGGDPWRIPALTQNPMPRPLQQQPSPLFSPPQPQRLDPYQPPAFQAHRKLPGMSASAAPSQRQAGRFSPGGLPLFQPALDAPAAGYTAPTPQAPQAQKPKNRLPFSGGYVPSAFSGSAQAAFPASAPQPAPPGNAMAPNRLEKILDNFRQFRQKREAAERQADAQSRPENGLVSVNPHAQQIQQLAERIEDTLDQSEKQRLINEKNRLILHSSVQQHHYQGIALPRAVYQDPVIGQELDLWQALAQDQDLSDPQLNALIFSIRQMQLSVRTPEELIDAEVVFNLARNGVAANKLAHLEELEPGYWEYNGMLLPAEEAEVIVDRDVDHYWQTGQHLTPGQVIEKLKDFSVTAWNFLYGDDINTLLDPQAHPLAKAWAAAQFIPVGKVLKAGKIIQVVKFRTTIPLSKLLPVKPKATPGTWVFKKGQHPNKYFTKHADKHLAEFKEFGLKTSKDYRRLSEVFLKHPPSGTIVKTLPDGQKLLYHARTNILHISINGRIINMYRPNYGALILQETKNEGVYSGFIIRRTRQ